MDNIDRKILAQLQQNGRISLTELADTIGLSLAPCQRRVKNLENLGIITGYRAMFNASKLGLNFSAIVFVTLKNTDSTSIDAFEQAVQEVNEITQAERLFGEPDYMLHVVCSNIQSFQRLYDVQLSRLPNVLRLTSTLVMKQIVNNRLLPNIS